MKTPTENYRGSIRPVDIGGLVIGGGAAFPFHDFDGDLPNPPRVAFEVWDCPPEDWSPELSRVFGEALSDPVTWAAAIARIPSAEAIYLCLKSADPHGLGRSIEDTVARAKRILESAGLPAFIGNAESDTYQAIGTGAAEHADAVIAFTPMDVSLAKQLNVLLAQAGVPEADIVMDPTCSALGYSFEYAFTVFERDRLAALAQNDAKMQAPLIATVGQESWHVKESRVAEEELPGAGALVTRTPAP